VEFKILLGGTKATMNHNKILKTIFNRVATTVDLPALNSDIQIIDIKNIARGQKHGQTVSGTTSLKLDILLKGEKISAKMYNCSRTSHASFREKIETLHEDLYLPKVLYRHRYTIIEEWIPGKTYSKSAVTHRRKMEKHVKSFLQNPNELPTKLEISSFDYFNFLKTRLKPWLFIPEIEYLYDNFQFQYEKVYDSISPRLSHNDLNSTNLIYDDERERTYVIDNEFLAYNRCWVMNLKNSLLTDDLPNSKFSADQKKFIEITWKCRRLGKFLSHPRNQNMKRIREQIHD